jgi:xanthine dehydrogenase accessory factor
MVAAGEIICEVAGRQVKSRIGGIVRGLMRSGAQVVVGQKIGDVDPRGIKERCFKISDKANAIAGGVLEALLALRAGLK